MLVNLKIQRDNSDNYITDQQTIKRIAILNVPLMIKLNHYCKNLSIKKSDPDGLQMSFTQT